MVLILSCKFHSEIIGEFFFQKAGGAGWDGLAVMAREIAISAMPKTHFTAPMDGHEQTASHGQSWKCQKNISGVFCEISYFSAEIGNETQSIWSWNGLKHVKTTNHIGLQMIKIDLPFYFRHDSLQNPGGMGPRRRSLQRPMYPMWKPLRGPPNGYDDRKGEFCPVSMGVSVPSVVIKHGLPDNPPCISIFSGFFLFSHPNLRLWRIFDNRWLIWLHEGIWQERIVFVFESWLIGDIAERWHFLP